MNALVFCGDSLDDLRSFPNDARRTAGFEIDRVQRGLDPRNWKPMPSIGKGVREIRVRERSGAFRVIYVTKIAGAVHVLHAFQKKSQATAQTDINLARQRLKGLIE